MTEEQRREEIHRCHKEINKNKEILKLYHNQYDQIRYHYEPSFMEARLRLRDAIEKHSEVLTCLLLKVDRLNSIAIN
jgi:hypothetical protein